MPVFGISAVHSARTPDGKSVAVRNRVSGVTRRRVVVGAAFFVTFFFVASFVRVFLVLVAMVVSLGCGGTAVTRLIVRSATIPDTGVLVIGLDVLCSLHELQGVKRRTTTARRPG